MTKAVGYLRVSTGKQDTELQEKAVLSYIESRGWGLQALLYRDVASGNTRSRVQLDKMISLMQGPRREFDAVVVWKFDRLARSTRQLLDFLELCRRKGIHFVSVTEGIDTSTPMGEMIFTVVAALAQFERTLIRERVQAGVDLARARGKPLGRPRRVFHRDRVATLREEGLSWREIGQELDVPPSTVRRVGSAVPLVSA